MKIINKNNGKMLSLDVIINNQNIYETLVDINGGREYIYYNDTSELVNSFSTLLEIMIESGLLTNAQLQRIIGEHYEIISD